MSHPNAEEWAQYVSGDLEPRERRTLSAHLQDCPECAMKVASWERTVAKLQKWRLAETRPRPLRRRVEPVLKWAIAAALVLGMGVALGRMSSPDRDGARMLREVQSALARNHADCSNAIAAMEARVQQQSEADTRQLWRGTLETITASRVEDRRALLALLERQTEQQDRKLIALRQELETLASMADKELREAQLKILQFASTRNDEQ